jgi:hypothetical protein
MGEQAARGPTIAGLEAAVQNSFVRLRDAATIVQYCADHYLDGLAVGAAQQHQQAAQAFARLRTDAAAGHAADLEAAEAELRTVIADGAATIGALVSSHPWMLSGFDAPTWDRYKPAAALVPDGLRVGSLRAADAPGLPLLPAVVRAAGAGHVLITAAREGVTAARSLLQALTLRLVVATQPGRVRLALADPSGQGQHLSAFLRLPAALRAGDLAVSGIEVSALLRGLTEHVSEVNKTRLTNVYDSVEAYNAAGAGMPIPYRVLVVDGFPAGFTEESAALLTMLAQNGPRAGVYIMARLERDMKLPREFDLTTLTSRATNLRLTKSGKLTWDDPEFRLFEVEPDQMPAADRANAWLEAVAAAASTATRTVPFGRLAVPPAQRQHGRAVDGLMADIAVDSKGELVRFVMGSDGRPQHGLLGGTTRMGKSNLLHVLILQLALRYPPEELDLYLLDFKEVEFNVYLTQRLPHARVIASRADREFGLSVLRRFREEIERRSRLFYQVTDNTVTNLAEYTQATGNVLPQALLIMDEFQVLFESDGRTNVSDRIATEAGFLLGDIARRGAAFGLHLLLSTQSPGGDLAGYLNTTYQQLTLRIAVPCTEPRSGPQVSDAILGDDTAVMDRCHP